MKQIYLLMILCITGIANAQISTNGTVDGSIIITPKGLQGSSNSATGAKSVSLGFNALRNNVGSANTAVGDSSLFTNTSGYFNTALGAFSLQNNTIGRANVALGYASLYANENADFNTGIGNLALTRNTSGQRNTAIGNAALYSNTTAGFNTGIGNAALFNNTLGQRNTGIGTGALFNNQVGEQNTAVGSLALLNSNAEGNTAIGHQALRSTSSGILNTAIGLNAGNIIETGGYNAFVGFGADATTENISNSIAIGANAKVDASNKVRIGDPNITVIEGQVAWSNPSDRLLKENIVYSNRIGLGFVHNLQTVSYNYIADKNKTRYDGFIAQDIEKLMKDLNIPFSGLKRSDDGMLSLAYSDFVMPLVNSIQEQQKEIERLRDEVNSLKKQAKETSELKSRLEQIEAKFIK